MLHRAFCHFDKENCGYITIRDLKEFMSSKSSQVDDMRHILGDMDTNNDGRINFDEFCKYMRMTVRQEYTPKLSRHSHLLHCLGSTFVL